MARLSAVFIVKDKSLVLAACIERLSWVDEIIVQDSGNADDTVKIARQH
jgi:glycosyltransferase involved in cell wall biosynthesis